MSNGKDFLFGNVVPLKKSGRFGVYLGEVTSTGEVIEGESVGIAFLKNGSDKFRLKLFVFPNNQYFVVPAAQDDTKYLVLSFEEYELSTGEIRTSWNRVGEGQLVGGFIALRMHLLAERIFLCLFPHKTLAAEDSIAS